MQVLNYISVTFSTWLGIQCHYDQLFCLSIGIRGLDKREENSNYSRPETRCMCQALMKISLKDGLYYVYEFEPEHNHILATASQAHLLRSQRSITTAQLASVEAAKVVAYQIKPLLISWQKKLVEMRILDLHMKI